MSKTTKIWLVIATSFVVFGGILFMIGMSEKKWDFTKLSTEKYETNTYQISEEFNNISMELKTADVFFMPSTDEMCKVVCYEPEKVKHLATVSDETLTISVVDKRQWYDHIGVMVDSPKITVYLPEKEYASLFIKGSTGDVEVLNDMQVESVDIAVSTGNISLENVTTDNMNLSVSTGDITAALVKCEGEVKVKVGTGKTKLDRIRSGNLHSIGSTGDVILSNVIVTEVLSIERSTGDVKFEGCDAGEILIKTTTGDVVGNLLSDKVFFAEANTGKVEVPKTTTGGKCEINTSTGNIKVEIITADGTTNDVEQFVK